VNLPVILLRWTNHFCYSDLSHIATILSRFMILSAILEILLIILTMLSHFAKVLDHSRDFVSHSREWLMQVQAHGVRRLTAPQLVRRMAPSHLVWCSLGSVDRLDRWVQVIHNRSSQLTRHSNRPDATVTRPFCYGYSIIFEISSTIIKISSVRYNDSTIFATMTQSF
jgi:hypothetical protein